MLNEDTEGFQFRSLIKVSWKENLCTKSRSEYENSYKRVKQAFGVQPVV